MRGAIPPLTHACPWRGAQLKHRDIFTFTKWNGVLSRYRLNPSFHLLPLPFMLFFSFFWSRSQVNERRDSGWLKGVSKMCLRYCMHHCPRYLSLIQMYVFQGDSRHWRTVNYKPDDATRFGFQLRSTLFKLFTLQRTANCSSFRFIIISRHWKCFRPYSTSYKNIVLGTHTQQGGGGLHLTDNLTVKSNKFRRWSMREIGRSRHYAFMWCTSYRKHLSSTRVTEYISHYNIIPQLEEAKICPWQSACWNQRWQNCKMVEWLDNTREIVWGLLTSHLLSKNLKMKIQNPIILLVVLYGYDTWLLTPSSLRTGCWGGHLDLRWRKW
jgi:hypothetical protein